MVRPRRNCARRCGPITGDAQRSQAVACGGQHFLGIVAIARRPQYLSTFVLAGGCFTTGRPPPVSPPPRSVPQAALSQAGKVGLLWSGIAAVTGPPVAALVVLRPRCEFRVSRHERPDSRLDNRANSRCFTMGVFLVVGQDKPLISHETSSPLGKKGINEQKVKGTPHRSLAVFLDAAGSACFARAGRPKRTLTSYFRELMQVFVTFGFNGNLYFAIPQESQHGARSGS